MHTRYVLTLFIAAMALVLHFPNDAYSKSPYTADINSLGKTWLDFNKDGFVDYVTTDPETGHLSWFLFQDGDWQAVSGIEAVDPWRQSNPDIRTQLLRKVLAQEDVPQLFAVTYYPGQIRVVDTETGISAHLGSMASFQDNLAPNALTSASDSTLTIFSNYYHEGHLLDFGPVAGNLLADNHITIPRGFDIRGLAALDEDSFYAVHRVPEGLWGDPECELWLLHLQSQSAELIGSLGDRFHLSQSLAISPDGVLYGWHAHYGLMRIDSATGMAEYVDEANALVTDIQGLAFGPDGTLYGGRGRFYRIDTETGRAEMIGPTSPSGGYGPDIRGLAFANADLQEVGFGLGGGYWPSKPTERSLDHFRGFITGSEDLDVSRIETSSVLLAGDFPVENIHILDIATRPESPGDFPLKGADGFPDLVFFFDWDSLYDFLWPNQIGDFNQLDISAKTVDGTLLFGSAAISPDDEDDLLKTNQTKMAPGGLSAYPNPFNPMTTFSFRLESPGNVSLLVYDHRGRLVRTLVQGFYSAGDYQEIWNGRDNRGAGVSSGSYRALLRTPGGRQSIAILLLR